MKPLDRSLIRVGLALGLFALTALPAASRDESYGYFRVIEGSATLMQNDGDRQPADVNQPVLAGDRIWVPERSRAEVVLADRNILRIDGGSEVLLEQLAASPDRNDPATVLRVQDGNVLLAVTTDSLGDQLPRVETPNATLYTQDFGTYRITASQGRFTELVVRRGKAEVVTDRGSEIVRAGELAYVEGDRYATIEIADATSYDALERWADKLEGEARYASNEYAGNEYAGNGYVDEDLRYQAAPLARYGSWIHYSGRPYWRPRVAVDWRPYWHGRWAYTPAGLNWVSYEPWGWVPYHYGSWDYLPGYGWAWAPGRHWAPAWVYWYWGPSYVGWCPTGYYTSFYRHRYPYFHHGVYGWAGGHWDHWNHWSFVRHDYFSGYRHGYRDGFKDSRRDHWDVRRFAVPRDDVRRAGPLERGVITTDTRPLTPDNWNEPRQAIRVLTAHPTVRGQERGERPNGELPDVTPFIRRMPELPDNVVRTVVPRDADAGGADTGQGRGTRPTVAERPRGGTPWEGGVIYTDPSDRGRSNGSTPRVRVPDQGNLAGSGGNTPSAERPRAGRPEPGQGGGAPRPDGADAGRGDRGERNDRNDRGGATPRVRVPEMPQQGGESPRTRRPEAGSPGGAPRDQGREREQQQEIEREVRERARQREQQENETRERTQERERQQELEQQMRERAREREQQQEYEMRERAREREQQQQEMQERMREQARERERDQQQAYERAREREQQEQQQREQQQREQQQREQQQRDNETRERARERETRPPSSSYRRPDSSRSYDAPRSVERQREAPPSSASRPERRQEARPAERERGGSRGGESQGSESRGGDGGRSGGSRGSRSRPPG